MLAASRVVMRAMDLADALIFTLVLAADLAVLALLRRRRRHRVARERMQINLRRGVLLMRSS
jgi:hypothetical protein